MDISKLTPNEAIEAVKVIETVEQLRKAANSLNIKFSGNTGEGTLTKNILKVLSQKLIESKPKPKNKSINPSNLLSKDDDDEEIQKAIIPKKKPAEPTIEELLEMDPNTIENPQLLRQVVRAQALKLNRVRVTNLDPSDAQLQGAIITSLNKYTGKVSRFIPFGDENEAGTHVEEILLNHLKQQKFALRKEKKSNQFGVKQYDTRMVSKYSIEHLKPLTQDEINELAALQRASHSIDT